MNQDSKYTQNCHICGKTIDQPHVAHLIPRSQGGDEAPENLLALCPNCHLEFDRGVGVREADFIDYLAALLRADPEFDDVQTGTLLGQYEEYRADITARRRVGDHTFHLLVECKSRTTLSELQVQEIAENLQYTREYSSNRYVVFATPAILPADSRKLLTNSGVEVWDLPYLAQRFREQAKCFPHPLQALFLGSGGTRGDTVEDQLAARLTACARGVKGWVAYQKLVRDIFELLFCPPLSTPHWELSDRVEVNRRDLIFPNYTPEGFWAFMRNRFRADHVVVDAKNYTEAVGKDQILPIAHYLKDHGAGLFGIVVSREGANESCYQTQKEVWVNQRKLIVVLDDSDIQQMLLNRVGQLPPEDVLRQRIEAFRLGL